MKQKQPTKEKDLSKPKKEKDLIKQLEKKKNRRLARREKKKLDKKLKPGNAVVIKSADILNEYLKEGNNDSSSKESGALQGFKGIMI
ncbi:hypothetical protein Ocin01_14481 [Orchesella cincta]|uniref:Uncharacterized protein n=1 Tax=Orchesella cincta TaxID=48709 RepID=A0A1D2MGS3_ORCCI|nr:hypothetical protein Ocin01_14481 [Orchesella cincta]